MDEQKKCKRNGCKKPYSENQNHDTACNHHPGKPIFHDLKKGWTCCNKIVYDWDEFQNIQPCAQGKHTDEVQDTEFYKSNTVNAAQKGLDRFQEQTTVVKNINDFNKEQAEIKKKQQQEEAQIVKKIFITPNGKNKCINKGCNKEFDPNIQEECKYHSGEPIFHDLKKSWTCCKIEKYDWDEFVKIPTCSIGKHNPKLV